MGGPEVRAANDSWLPPARRPTRGQKRRMTGSLIKEAIKLVMKNHYTFFNNVIRKQTKGGAIGTKLTERLVKLLMNRHVKKYLKFLLMLKVENELFERYVDDTTNGMAAFDPEVRLNG